MSAGQLNVLVVDDDEAMRRLLVDIISRDEHQVVAVESAEEALESLPFWTFQVAFLDHNLPGMEGLVLGQYLRRNNPHMTIALVTGDDDERLPGQTRDAGIAFVAKPFEPEVVRRLLREYAEEAEERRVRRHEQQASDYGPPIADYATALTESFGIPKVPGRVQNRIVETLKRSLNNLRSPSRYTERDRVVALSGLVAAKVLGIELPRTKSERTLFEEYDALMRENGRRPEFSEDAAEVAE